MPQEAKSLEYAIRSEVCYQLWLGFVVKPLPPGDTPLPTRQGTFCNVFREADCEK